MSAPLNCNVIVLGSGFGGSLTALLLQRIGLKPVLIDRGTHPRFAIGESSTPVADLVLADLSQKYDLPRLRPLAKYGSWKATYPELRCGIKRGFSYFQHTPHERFRPAADHANELLVAASSDDEHADTHWHRADVDAFFAAEVRREGIPFFEGMNTSISATPHGWRARTDGDAVNVTATFLVDATGEAGVMRRTLDITDDATSLHTQSRAIFAHFDGVRRWHDLLPEGSNADYPFPCDHAALHQVIDEGWMWQLRFDSGIVSAGFAIDAAASPLNDSLPIDTEWQRLLNRYPSIAEQFAAAKIVAPAGLRRTGRMQRLASQMAGENWAMLPNTAGFIDPLHSTGIAQTLCGIERLIDILEQDWRRGGLASKLHFYERSLRDEFEVIDRIVAAGYASRRHFRLFAATSMLYFAAATTYERRRQAGESPPGSALLCADDLRFRDIVFETDRTLRTLLKSEPTDASIDAFVRKTANAIARFNHVGLSDPAANNMYRYTALPT
jgi:FADH2 O2-dependent halogenase